MTGLSGIRVWCLIEGGTRKHSVFPPMQLHFAQSVSNAQSYARLPCKRSRRSHPNLHSTNGTGAAAPTNVTDVAVNCTTNTLHSRWHVSGGLAGTARSLAERRCADSVGGGQRRLQLPVRNLYRQHLRRDGADAAQRADANLFIDQRQRLVSSSNVTNIGVTCTTNTYTVGGAVSG